MDKNMDYRKLIKQYDRNLVVDKISNGEYDTDSSHSTSLHRHTFFQIVWIYKGKGELLIEDRKYKYSDGSVFVLAPHLMHQIRYGKDVEGYVISFSDIFLDNLQYKSTLLFYSLGQGFIQVPMDEQKLLDTDFGNLYFYLHKSDFFGKSRILQNYLHIILTKIEGYKRSEDNEVKFISDLSYQLLERFVVLVRENFVEEKNLEFYEKNLAVSRRKLSNVIKDTAGVSPAKFVERYSLNEAARMLCFSNYSIKEIALQTGYMDSSYFTKAFKKAYNLTPIQYRDKFVDSNK